MGKSSGSKKSKKPEKRPLMDGISIFDLIIPWKAALLDKNENKSQKESNSHQTSLQAFLDPTKPGAKSNKTAAKKTKEIDSAANNLVEHGLAKVVQSKEPIQKINFDNYA